MAALPSCDKSRHIRGQKVACQSSNHSTGSCISLLAKEFVPNDNLQHSEFEVWVGSFENCSFTKGRKWLEDLPTQDELGSFKIIQEFLNISKLQSPPWTPII